MARKPALSMDEVLQVLRVTGPQGMTPDDLASRFPAVSRSTVSRRLRDLELSGAVKPIGKARAIRYAVVGVYSVADVRRYFETAWSARPLVGFDEALLGTTPNFDPEYAGRLVNIQARARALDRSFLADFLIDFSWASSLLEGSTYSDLDTQVLIEYGARNPDKPLADALLALNHKNAIHYLWEHRDLTTETLCQLQSRLTDSHDQPEAAESDHFLTPAERGVPREYQEVRLGRSAYSPPFRPATGYVGKAFAQIVATAGTLPPIQAAFYLMTRIPYLQVFANGNKRTARLAANLPLLKAGLLPISFVDFNKADYVMGMAAFYELGDVQLLQQVFLDGYIRSIVRGSNIPAAMRVTGLNTDKLARELTGYVRTGKAPAAEAGAFLATG
jgi:Fic family protein